MNLTTELDKSCEHRWKLPPPKKKNCSRPLAIGVIMNAGPSNNQLEGVLWNCAVGDKAALVMEIDGSLKATSGYSPEYPLVSSQRLLTHRGEI